MIYYVLKTAVDTLFKYKIHLCYAHGFFYIFLLKNSKAHDHQVRGTTSQLGAIQGTQECT